MKKLTADVARRIKNRATDTIHTSLQSIIDQIAAQCKAGGCNDFILLEPKSLDAIAKELEERGFRVWVKEDSCYIEVEC